MRVNVEEKLAAILVADYERLIAHDRGGAQAALQLCYHEVIDTAIAVYGGRIFQLEPERMRAEFTSPLAAVWCAVEIRGALARRMADVPHPRASGCASASTTARRRSITASSRARRSSSPRASTA